ncbi:hypothetical protein ABRP93_04555 [Corynebacterium sp. KPL2850]|jgi:hypothetical protein|uniref:hypothetical protein n=1 Tax=unclassified Corynebacterium TaxID=2624378 RepID=UPI0003B8EA11|nr:MULTISPECIES: hypothetical protein [unclassified Corynebacterium]ERS50775.1 hypothetical protein HMPREF1281_01943 [Corynebacterium sp. KPL1855]ERS62769.1 hypothetical protein HMPREF1257_01745 [Corynebacterium sp. KPL1814]ERS80090.1 hypothetical protein HMPREF1285_00891 [Corynebacterium sp. KPL1859]
MKRIVSLLSISLLAAGLASCSSPNDEAENQAFSSPTTQASSEETSAPESTEETTTTTKQAEEDKDSHGLKQRDAKDFLATGPAYEQMNSWGVKSPDGKVQCSLNEQSEGPWCSVNFSNPPILPDPEIPQWDANMVSYKKGAGFFPSAVVEPGDLVPAQPLKAGEEVEINGITFSAPREDEFTVTANGHHFTLKDNGQFSADTYPLEPDSNGYAEQGTICGQMDTRWGLKNVYAQVDGTNCPKAMEVVDYYVHYDFKPEEVNTRGILNIGEWECSFAAPKFLDDTEPSNRLPNCQDRSGISRVVLLDA